MKINEAEQEVGITRKNIRFYEQQGLLKPMRNLSNGYRDYSAEDIRILRQIKLLRRLGIPIEEIKRLQARLLTLEDCLQRHLITLERERKNLDATASFCERLLSEKASLETIDAGQLLTDIDNMEEGGTRFVNVQKRDQKALRRNSLLSAIVFISFMLAFIAFYDMVQRDGQRYARTCARIFHRHSAPVYRRYAAGAERKAERN